MPQENTGRMFRDAASAVSRSIQAASSDVSGSSDKLRKSLEGIGKGVRDSSAFSAADLLTSAEIEELRLLVDAGDSANEVAGKRLESGESVRGMYLQLSDIGFMHCYKMLDGGIVFVTIDPKAAWAVERHDLRERERAEARAEVERRRSEDAKRQLIYLVIGWVVGIASTPLGDLLGTLMRWLLQSIGIGD